MGQWKYFPSESRIHLLPSGYHCKIRSTDPLNQFWKFISKWGQFISTIVGVYWFLYIWYWLFSCLKTVWPPSPRRLVNRFRDLFGRRNRRNGRRSPRRFSPRGRRGRYSPARSEQQQESYEIPLQRSRSPRSRPHLGTRRNSTHSSLQSLNTMEQRAHASSLSQQRHKRWSPPAWAVRKDLKLSPSAPSYKRLEDLDNPRYTTMPVAPVPTADQVKKNSLVDPVMPTPMGRLYPVQMTELMQQQPFDPETFDPEILRRQILHPDQTEAFNPSFQLDTNRVSAVSHQANHASSPQHSPTTNRALTGSPHPPPPTQMSSFNSSPPPQESMLLLHYLEGIMGALPQISQVNETFRTKCLAIEEQLHTLKPMLLSQGLTDKDLNDAANRLQLHHESLVAMATTLPDLYENIFPEIRTDASGTIRKRTNRPPIAPKPGLNGNGTMIPQTSTAL